MHSTMANKLLIDSNEYDLDKLLQTRGSHPPVMAERHLVVDPRVASKLRITYTPEIHPEHPAYLGKILFYRHDNLYYALIGREQLYKYLDDHQVIQIPGFSIPKMALKKARLTEFRHEGHSDDPVRVENQWRSSSDRRTMNTTQDRIQKHSRYGKY